MQETQVLAGQIADPYREEDKSEVRYALVKENRGLSETLSHLSYLKTQYEPIQLAKDIRTLQEASRIQKLNVEIRQILLTELQRRKLIKQILDNEA